MKKFFLISYPLKRIIKLLISILFFLTFKIHSSVNPKRKNFIAILYYHGITKRSSQNFNSQLNYLKRKYKFISIFDTDKNLFSKLNIVLTFDDALVSVLNYAYPELLKREIPFLVFVPTGYLGKVPDWEIDSDMKSISESVMSIDQLKTLNESICTFGSHTINHKNLTNIPLLEAKKEMLYSKEMLETIFEKKITSFSFPYGAYNLELVKLAKEIGYTRIYTTNTSLVSIDKDHFLFDRISVSPEDWKIELFLKIHGGYNWIGFLQRRRYEKNN